MTKKELEAKVRELEARIALLEAQRAQQTQVLFYPPQWGPPTKIEGPLWMTVPAVDLTRGAGAVAEEGALNMKTYTFGQ